jgi:exonuclease V gamma subunit
MHRNEQCEPSVVLSELMDYCRHGYDLPANYLVTHHPLQPFGKDYFLKDKRALSSNAVSARLVSFNRLAWEIASAKNSAMQTTVMGDERWNIAKNIAVDSTVYVTLDEFVTFFIKPWDWFFSKKHKVWLDIEDTSVNDDETLDGLDNLEQWTLRNTLIQQINSQSSVLEASEETRDELIDQLVLQKQAAGAWPLGKSAATMKETLKTLSADYLWASQGSKPLHVSIPITHDSHTIVIECRFSVTDDGCFIVHSASKSGEHHQLDFYIRLALLAAAVIPGFTLQKGVACFYDDKKGRVLEEILKADINDAVNARFLSILAELYITYQQTGLPFEPKLSKQLADLRESEDSDAETMDDEIVRQNAEERLAAVDETWNTRSEWVTGMAFDAKKSSYFAHVETVKSASFQAVSERVWEGVSAWYQNTACRVEQDAADKKAAKAAKGKKS